MAAAPTAEARCACGAVVLEIQTPAFWAWHDHSRPTQHAHGAACATYVGTWRSRLRIVRGADTLARYEDGTGKTRHFCAHCGTPVLYERAPRARMVNIPRALFTQRTGREPRYHIAMDQAPDWEYRGEPLVPLKGHPGVLWTGGRKRKEGPS